jgi:hypothetical protein
MHRVDGICQKHIQRLEVPVDNLGVESMKVPHAKRHIGCHCVLLPDYKVNVIDVQELE